MAVVADVFYGRPSTRLEVAGVTGTNGKTTVTVMLRSILEAAGRRTGLVGTVDWIVGGVRRDAAHTTPESIELQRLLAEMVAAGDEAVAIEASSHGSHFRRLDRIRFDALAFTNLSAGSPRYPRRHGELLPRQAPPVHRGDAPTCSREHR